LFSVGSRLDFVKLLPSYIFWHCHIQLWHKNFSQMCFLLCSQLLDLKELWRGREHIWFKISLIFLNFELQILIYSWSWKGCWPWSTICRKIGKLLLSEEINSWFLFSSELKRHSLDDCYLGIVLKAIVAFNGNSLLFFGLCLFTE
jgi:hypothetical protein